jgi:rhodanese-related sulfurtransferase
MSERFGTPIASFTVMQKISVDEVKERLDRGEPVIFIDARSQESWEQSDVQIPGSTRVPPDRADEFVGAIAPEAAIVTYCT